MTDGSIVFSNESGRFFKSNEKFLKRYVANQLSKEDSEFLLEHSFAYQNENSTNLLSYAWQWAARNQINEELSYIILVPTLRCDLSCSYCQVSRASINAKNFDWNSETEKNVIKFLDTLTTKKIKIEFQGGEPTLRIDVLKRIRDFCRSRFESSTFVICTNLQLLNNDLLDFYSDEDTFISTSLDGDILTHTKNRTNNVDLTKNFYSNLDYVVRNFGLERVSALPTIDGSSINNNYDLIRKYSEIGFKSIYFRLINFHGFARKNFDSNKVFQDKYDLFLDSLIKFNIDSGNLMTEYYLNYCLNKIFNPNLKSHVDLRNPNPVGIDYVVIDYDGQIYPTDEARMLSRVNQIDLNIGNVLEGIDKKKQKLMNEYSFNNWDPDCVHCAYQSFCGVDNIDHISRYGKIDIPKHQTVFCQRQMYIFGKAFELIYSRDEVMKDLLHRWLNIENVSNMLAVEYDPD